ncbi:MAG: GatB/YqeY domain-containing protein [Gammaproteobacteria bacterium]|nr:GatB/YqeY domain-containing protein [Gammaproteobacteria bacterium]
MSLQARLQQDVKDTMRAKDSKKLGVLRLLTAAIKQIEVDERITVGDDRLLQILDKLAKQRKESIAQFQTANRQDLVEKEEYELELIKTYLPVPLTEEAILSLIETTISQAGATTAADMGKVMAILKPQIQGRCDMGRVSAIVKVRLQPS